MSLQKIIKKFFFIELLVFLLINSSSIGFYKVNFQDSTDQEDPIPYVFGQFGENQWYISAVIVGFYYDSERVKEINYKLDNIWYTYNAPFTVTKDGYYNIQWYWIDLYGRPHNGLDILFKLDQTPPTIELIKKSAGKNKVSFTANVVDTVSQIERVEFYLDDVLQETLYQPPYQYNWTGKEQHWVYAIGYNFAGLSEKSNNVSTPRLQIRSHNLLCVIFNFLQKIFLRI